MNIDDEVQKWIVGTGGFGLGGGLFWLLFNKLWRVSNSTVRENSKDQAERKLYENLRDQIDALTEQINQLTLRSDVQEEAIRKINYKRRESQKIASEAYFELVMFCTAQQCPPCPRLESIKAKLNQIIDN